MSWFSALTSQHDDKARRMVASGAVLLDVRTPGEFASGHLDGALNIPVQELGSRLGELSGKRDVVVYCRSGGRSAAAAQILTKAGHRVVDVGAMGNY